MFREHTVMWCSSIAVSSALLPRERQEGMCAIVSAIQTTAQHHCGHGCGIGACLYLPSASPARMSLTGELVTAVA